MALQDWGELDKDLGPEPFPYLYSHGLIIKDGNKMSKSRGNVVNPDEYIKDFGADSLRMYLMFLGPYDQGGDFRDTGMRGMSKFLDRVWRLIKNHKDLVLVEADESREVLVKLHQTVKKVTEDMGELKFNTSIAALMEFTNFLEAKTKSKTANKGKNGLKCAEWEEALQKLVLMLSPMAPFLAEELWSVLGGKFSVHQQSWPDFNVDLTKSEQVTVVAQVNGKVRGEFEVSQKEAQDKEMILKLAYEQERVKMQLTGKKVIKEIFVPGKLVNLVVKE
jgi:leucyl-tRNA synthetase